ncbi:MAG: hypothetical protein OSA98_13685 [Rubripirellula sp.]|nr:hypothetical protein [Rubripirellula sp.]
MNINDNQAFTDQLAKMAPAPTGMDPRRVFYEAGFKAGGEKTTPPANGGPGTLIAACLVTLVLVVPASFYAGMNQAGNNTTTNRLANQPSGEWTPSPANPEITQTTPGAVINPPDASNSEPSQPAGQDTNPTLADRSPASPAFSQWARSLFLTVKRFDSVTNNEMTHPTISIAHGSLVSQTENTAEMLDGAISANLQNEFSRGNARKPGGIPPFAPTPGALLKYFTNLETVQ